MTRQTKYTSDMPDRLVSLARAKKLTIEQFCSEISITRPTFYVWLQKYPRFKEAAGIARIELIAHVQDLLYNAAFRPDEYSINTNAAKLYLSTVGIGNTDRAVAGESDDSEESVANIVKDTIAGKQT